MICRANITRSRSNGGFSLIELLIVLVIVGVMSAYAIFSLGDSSQNLQRQNIAKEFKVSLDRARFDSIKRRPNGCVSMSRVEITGPSSFALLTDSNQDGVVDTSTETRTVNFGDHTNVGIVSEPLPSYPIVIRFDRHGRPTTGECGAESPLSAPIIFCNMPCTAATADGTNSNMVFVTSAGTTALMKGASLIETASPPPLASLNNANQINPLLVVWDSPPLVPYATPSSTPLPTTTPSPVASPSPAPVASPSPTVSPTGSPNPAFTPTPTPTPTPRWCYVGEAPAQANCICSQTQYLQTGSGKCRSL